MTSRLPAACVAAVMALCGCDTMQRAFGSGDGQRPTISGLEAALTPIGGSAVSGSVRFVPRGDGVSMLVQINGLPPGRFRVLVHANGNCSSPNGFSAGAPWSPAGSPQPLYERLPILNPNADGTGTLTTRIAGLPIEQLSGHSVVVHDAITGPYTAEPGVRNARIACGVLGPLRTMF